VRIVRRGHVVSVVVVVVVVTAGYLRRAPDQRGRLGEPGGERVLGVLGVLVRRREQIAGRRRGEHHRHMRVVTVVAVVAVVVMAVLGVGRLVVPIAAVRGDVDDRALRAVRVIVGVERQVEVRQDLDAEEPQHARRRGEPAATPLRVVTPPDHA
jgi:hypothetical protein